MIKNPLLASLILLFASPLSGMQDYKEQIDKFFEKAVKTYNIPALSIAVVDDKNVIYSFYGGDAKGSQVVSSDTPFLLGSTSKTFTALAVMRLVEQGKIELDKPVKGYLSDFSIQNKEYESKITVRHLLNHTSGLSSKGITGTSMGMDNLVDEMKILSTCNPDYAPGVRYAYFNSNYRLLGLLVERISGMPFQRFMYDEIFQPLQMSGTTAGVSTGTHPVCGYGQLFGLPVEREQVIRKGAVPSGYMISTAGDISKFLIEELKAYKGDSTHLNKETILKTWQLSDKSDNSYAMGWLVVTDSLGDKFYVHGGALEGYQSFFYLNPDNNIGFVILMNQGGVLPMLTFSVIRDGLISIINEEQATLGIGKVPVVIAIAMLLLAIALYVSRIIRLRHYRKSRILRKITMFLDFAFTLFIIWGFIPLMNRIMGDKADCKMLWNMLPEFCLLLAVICLGNIICGSIKVKQLIIDNKTNGKHI